MSDPLTDLDLYRHHRRYLDPLVTAWHQGECGTTLCALVSYWTATPAERAASCNGAGPAWLQAWLPRWLRFTRWLANSLWWCDCDEAFDIHDWDYARLPPTAEGKRVASSQSRQKEKRTGPLE